MRPSFGNGTGASRGPPNRSPPAGPPAYPRPVAEAPAPPPAPGGVFAHAEVEGFEQVAFGHDGPSGLRAIVAVHSTVLGPAIGGTRFRPYADEAEAVADVCRLARGMTYKHAVSGLDAGGGKAVILGDPRTLRTEALIRAYARFLDGLGGRYLTAEDVGTTQADMDLIRTETAHVTGTSEHLGGSGDPSPATAWGVLCALRTIAERRFDGELGGRHVVVSGVGKVGTALVDHLVAAGVRVTVADVDPTALARVRARHPEAAVVAPERAHAVACDVFSPCALGAVLDERTIGELRTTAVCGSANNQLADEERDGRGWPSTTSSTPLTTWSTRAASSTSPRSATPQGSPTTGTGRGPTSPASPTPSDG